MANVLSSFLYTRRFVTQKIEIWLPKRKERVKKQFSDISKSKERLKKMVG